MDECSLGDSLKLGGSLRVGGIGKHVVLVRRGFVMLVFIIAALSAYLSNKAAFCSTPDWLFRTILSNGDPRGGIVLPWGIWAGGAIQAGGLGLAPLSWGVESGVQVQ